MTNKLLMDFPRTGNYPDISVDCGEKIGEICLSPLRIVFGKKADTRSVDCEERVFKGRFFESSYSNSTATKIAMIVLSLGLFPLTLVVTGIGCIALACSNTHKQMFNIYNQCKKNPSSESADVELLPKKNPLPSPAQVVPVETPLSTCVSPLILYPKDAPQGFEPNKNPLPSPAPVVPVETPLSTCVSPLILYPKGAPQGFEVIKKLGNGGNGIVLLVRDLNGLKYAMKLNKPQKSNIECARTEGRMLSELNRERVPHIVSCFGDFDLETISPWEAARIDSSFGEGAVHAILMPLLSQDTYEMFCKKESIPLFLDDVLCIGRLALETLAHLGDLGVAHLDLKPENMTYDRQNNELFIGDFGSAVKRAPNNVKLQSRHRVGTRSYRAPELVARQSYDESVDMWSLGATLFELYTQRPLIPVGDSVREKVPYDYFHFLSQNMGFPPVEFIESIPESEDGCRGPFCELGKGARTYQISQLLSQVNEKYMHAFEQIGKLYSRDTPLWKARIYEVARRKRENGQPLIDFLQLMFSYPKRATPKEALRYFKSPGELQAS